MILKLRKNQVEDLRASSADMQSIHSSELDKRVANTLDNTLVGSYAAWQEVGHTYTYSLSLMYHFIRM